MESNTVISVLMTAYNRGKYIAEAIESVLASSYTNFELIIVDDCSSDNTVSIAKEYEAKDKRIKVYVNDKNLGDYPNRNKAAGYANGDLLMYVDSDDKILIDGIKNCVETMHSFPESSFGMYSPDLKQRPYLLDSKEAIKKHFFEQPFLMIGPGGTIIRRSLFQSINNYPTKYGPANDMYFNLKATCFSPIVLLPFEFVFYRRHANQEINNKYSYLVNNYRYLNDALHELPLPIKENEIGWLNKKNKRRFSKNIVRYFFKTFNFHKTIQAIRKADFTMSDFFQGIFHV